MSKVINPRIGIAFKKIFGVEENKDILISFLNSIICEEDQINEVELLNPYNENDFKKDSLVVLDLKAKNKHNGSRLLIEVQLVDDKSYLKQGLHSWTNVYSNQLIADGLDQSISRVIVIHILNFTLIDSSKAKKWKIQFVPKYHHEFSLRDRETGVEIFRDIEVHTLELKKFAINAVDIEGVIINIEKMLDQWMVFLTKHDLLDVENLPEAINVPEIKKALNLIRDMHLSKNEKKIYNSQLDALHRCIVEDKNKTGAKKKKTSIFEFTKSEVRNFIDFICVSFKSWLKF